MKSDKVAVWGRIVILLGFILLSASVLYSMRALTTSHTTQVPSKVPTLAFEPLSATAVNNFFGDPSCTWPCWQGITPGLTTSREAIQKLNVSPWVIELSPQMNNNDSDWGSTSWGWTLDKGQSAFVDVSWTDWVVDRILLDTYTYQHRTIPLREVIDRFGPPEKFALITCSGDYFLAKILPLCATLYYPKQGFEVDLIWYDTKFEDAQITPSHPIESVSLFKPSTIEERLAAQIIDDIQEADLHDWKGYGNFIKLYGRKP